MEAEVGVAIDGTPSMVDEVDDDTTLLVHQSKQIKVGIDEVESRSGVRTELMTLPSPRWKIPWVDLKRSATGIQAMLMLLSQDVEHVMGNVDCQSYEMKCNQNDFVNFEEEMSSKMDEGKASRKNNMQDSKAIV